jgi:hypothetical protein
VARVAAPPPPRAIPDEPEPAGYLDELFEEADEPVYAGGLPPVRSAYRRPSDGKALRLTLTILGLLVGLGIGLFGIYWLATSIGNWMPTGGGPRIAANPNAPAGAVGGDSAGWPVLGEPGPDFYPAGTTPKARKPSGTVRSEVVKQGSDMVLEIMGLLDRMLTALDGIHDAASGQAAMATIQGLNAQLQGMQTRMMSVPRPNAAENYEIGRRVKDRVRATVDRMRQVVQRLSTKPGNPVGAVRMMNDVERLSAGFEEQIKRSGLEAPTTPFVEVYIANVPDDQAAMLLAEKLSTGPANSAGNNSTYSGTHKAAVVRLWPVADPRAFAATIPFGDAQVSGHKIVILNPRIDPAEVAARQERERQEEETRRAEAAAREKEAAERREAEDPTPPPGADAITVAVIKLKSTNGFKVREGLSALARMIPESGRHAEVFPAVIPHATGTDHFNVIEAIKALANWRDDAGVRAMVHVIERSDDVFARREAIQQLARLREASAAPAIAQRLADDWPEAEKALRSMGDVAEPAVIAMLKSGDDRIRKTACEVLRDIGGQAALDAMLALPADPETFVRMAATEAMEKIAERLGPDAVRKLGRAARR